VVSGSHLKASIAAWKHQTQHQLGWSNWHQWEFFSEQVRCEVR